MDDWWWLMNCWQCCLMMVDQGLTLMANSGWWMPDSRDWWMVDDGLDPYLSKEFDSKHWWASRNAFTWNHERQWSSKGQHGLYMTQYILASGHDLHIKIYLLNSFENEVYRLGGSSLSTLTKLPDSWIVQDRMTRGTWHIYRSRSKVAVHRRENSQMFGMVGMVVP